MQVGKMKNYNKIKNKSDIANLKIVENWLIELPDPLKELRSPKKEINVDKVSYTDQQTKKRYDHLETLQFYPNLPNK
jgi:hypothetical protein